MIIIIVLILCCEAWRIFVLVFFSALLRFEDAEQPLRPRCLPADVRSMMRIDAMEVMQQQLRPQLLPWKTTEGRSNVERLAQNLRALALRQDDHGTKQSQKADGLANRA